MIAMTESAVAPFATAAEAASLLRHCGEVEDGAIDVAAAALALAALARPEAPVATYFRHLRTLADDVAAAARGRPPAAVPVAERVQLINAVLFGRHGYEGDTETYDDIGNADLMRVIDRRRGLPIALAILYVHAARAQGWTVEGVNFPGHFLLRLGHGGDSVIVDPFHGGRGRGTDDLRELVQATEGMDATLRRQHLQPAGNRDILLRLQNNIKLRLLRAEQLGAAAAVVERMLLLAPRQQQLWHELAQLRAKAGNLVAAIAAAERMAAVGGDGAQQTQARRLVGDLKSRLN